MEMFDEKNYHGTIQQMDKVLKQSPDRPLPCTTGVLHVLTWCAEHACKDFKLAQSLGFGQQFGILWFTCDPALKLKFMKEYYYKKLPCIPN